MKEYKRYFFQNETQVTILYEFDSEAKMKASGLLHDPRRTTCFMSSGKYYIGGHFET
jgi:uncharacterized protein YjaZ